MAAQLLSGVALAQEYEVTVIPSGGLADQAWRLNQNGDVCGFSRFEPLLRDEGFVFSGGEVVHVGFIAGRTFSNVWAVNNLGQAVGTSGVEALGENPRAFLWLGHLVDLGTLGGSRSSAWGINDIGQVVGSSTLPGDAETRAFLWEDGVMQTLPALGRAHATAYWINNSGQIVGTVTDDPFASDEYAVVWEGGQIQRLPPLNGVPHGAHYIHDNGDIAGYVRLPEFGGNPRAAVWRNGELAIRLGTLADGTLFEPQAVSVARAINADGVIVGMSTRPDGFVGPFIFRNGVMTSFDELIPEPWSIGEVGIGGLNDAGQIAAAGFIDGIPGGSGLLLTPRVLGDVNCDRQVNALDVQLFLLALLDPAAYSGQYPDCTITQADVNGDGQVDAVDIEPLVSLLLS